MMLNVRFERFRFTVEVQYFTEQFIHLFSNCSNLWTSCPILFSTLWHPAAFLELPNPPSDLRRFPVTVDIRSVGPIFSLILYQVCLSKPKTNERFKRSASLTTNNTSQLQQLVLLCGSGTEAFTLTRESSVYEYM